MSSPPASTPAAAPLAAVADQAPSARRRSAGSENVVVSRLSVTGASSAPPAPWRARAPISPGAALGQTSEQAEPGEQAEPEEEHSPAPEQVGRTAAEQAGEGKGVGVDDPLLSGRREVQANLHLRQRHVDDRDVDHDHELGHAAQGQDGLGSHRSAGLLNGRRGSHRCRRGRSDEARSVG